MIRLLQIQFFSLAFLLISHHTCGQSYTCANDNYPFLERAIGEWQVTTKDRIAVGSYQKNSGSAVISNAIEGCGITVSFRGSYKGKPYARQAIITGLDSTRIQMVSMDSEHGGFLTYEGAITGDTLEVIWYRNKEKRRLQSKYQLFFVDANAFNFSSYLSTDYGETWALTHQRLFERASPLPSTNFFSVIVKDIDKSIAWYTKLLGYRVLNRNTLESRGLDMANLENGKSRLELIELETSISQEEILEPKQKLQGLFKIGFSVRSLEPYLDTLMELNPAFNEQVVSDPVTGKKMIVFKDPDGNRIQLFER